MANKPNYIDPNVASVEVTIDGQTYRLAFTFGALATAESLLRKAGHVCNLLKALDFNSLAASDIVPLLYAAMLHFQPKTAIEDVTSMVSFHNLGDIIQGLRDAFIASMAVAEKKDESVQAEQNSPMPSNG